MAFCEKMPEAFPVSDRDGGSQDGLPLAKAEPICDGGSASGTAGNGGEKPAQQRQQCKESSERMWRSSSADGKVRAGGEQVLQCWRR